MGLLSIIGTGVAFANYRKVKAGYDAKTLAKELEEYYLKAHGSR